MSEYLRPYFGYATLLCFIISGVTLNFMQLIVFLCIKPFSKPLFREINSMLIYSYWSQPVAVADWITNVKCRVFWKDDNSFKECGTRPGIVISNHRYDIDWLAAWMFSDKARNLGHGKALAKSELRFVPVIGWGWCLSDIIFLSRDWNKDKETIMKSVDILLTYPKSIVIAYFEGTRFTQKKYEASVKFAEEKNLPVRLKHHLVPRTRGFVCMMQQVRARIQQDPSIKYGLYNIQVAVSDEDAPNTTMVKILGGAKITLQIYFGASDIMDLPVESEEATSNYLLKLYEEKDKLMEHFKKYGTFPGRERPYKPRKRALINWMSWMFVTYLGVFYVYYKCFTSGSTIYIVVMLTLAVSAIVAIQSVINSTKVSMSSSYGTTITRSKAK